MQVAELIAPREFRLTEQDLDPPAAGEVQVEVHAVGICGSDLHAYHEGAVGDTPNQYPMVLGHEPAGRVVATGVGVTGWSPGDRVALEPALYCYHCEFCRSGRHNVCANIRFLSNPGVPGFFRRRVNLPATNLVGVPDSLALETATLVEPLAIALHSLKVGAIQKDETVLVLGGGPIGLLTVACLKLAGAARIWAVEPVPARREMARKMGADDVFDPHETDIVREVMAATGKRGVDCSIDCAAKEDTTNQAIRAARNAGRVLMTGIHSEVRVPFEISPMRRKELSILMVRRSNHESHDALQLLLDHGARIAPLVTHTRPLDRIADAFRIAGSYEDGVGKMVIC
ncbi:MAG TPA: alcohol dehydrogenase catalytic domain-containing protein [Verrucomicrobiae bacterium]|nr:alcohol dehydrogenase catalytic domain-containing protein [Verrucomicrobiae bacterium]